MRGHRGGSGVLAVGLADVADTAAAVAIIIIIIIINYYTIIIK